MEEAADRYGPPPVSVLNLADYGRIRVMADRLGVEFGGAADQDGVGIRNRPEQLRAVRAVTVADLEIRPQRVHGGWRKLLGDQYDGLAHLSVLACPLRVAASRRPKAVEVGSRVETHDAVSL